MITTLRRFYNNLANVLDKSIRDSIFSTVEPHELIQWITAGRFAADIACQEKMPFDTKITDACKRDFCRFYFHKDDLPKTIWKIIPRFRRRLSLVYINEYIDIMNRGYGGYEGKLINWNVHGIKFQIEWEHWETIVEAHRSPTITLSAEIAYLWGRKKVAIESLIVERKDNIANIFGKFHKSNRFHPSNIRPHKKGLIPIPICSAWQNQHKGQKNREYTPVRPSVN
jgi:hypothetical protein